MQNLLVIVIFALAVWYLYGRLRRALSGKGGCGCGCSGCASRKASASACRSCACTIIDNRAQNGEPKRPA